MPKRRSNNDPPPVPPTRPDTDECCHSGCDPCIFDLYEKAMERYHTELRAWEERRGHVEKGKGRHAPS
ncbi:MAG: oxidoreductase-like domain-containing protein [Burkholderiales bacterium]